MAPSLGVQLALVNMRNSAEIERAVVTVARSVAGGLIVTASPLASIHRDLIIGAAQAAGVLSRATFRHEWWPHLSWTNLIDQYGLGAGYVDRILKGEKPADLPVRAPTKYGRS